MRQVCDDLWGGVTAHCELDCGVMLLGGGTLSELSRSLCQWGWLGGVIKSLEGPMGMEFRWWRACLAGVKLWVQSLVPHRVKQVCGG